MTRTCRPLPSSHALPPPPTQQALLLAHPGVARLGAPLRDLHALLSAAPDLVDAPLAERLAWLERCVRWVRRPLPLHARPEAQGSTGSVRLQLLVDVLAAAPAWREPVAALVGAVLAETSALRLLTEPGLPRGRGLLGDCAAVLSARLVPAVPEDHDLAQRVWRVFPEAADAAWLETLDEGPLAALCALLGPAALAPLAAGVEDAVAVLAARASALGLSRDVLPHLPQGRPSDSPFLALPRACTALGAAQRSGAPEAALAQARAACRQAVTGCRAAAAAVLAAQEGQAVDTDLTYRLELLGQVLDRVEALLGLRAATGAPSRPAAALRLLSGLVRAHAQERSVARLVQGSVRRLTRRIYEHTGEVGRHYISTRADDTRRLVRMAAGGGLLTAGTASLKLLIGFAPLALFFQGLAASANYALSFLVIQLLGFTLATKQPSMTAAALAAKLDREAGDGEMRGLVGHLRAMAGSQLASVFGNLSGVVGTVVALSVLLQALRGRPLLDANQAAYVLQALHPLKSGTVLFAALTGVLLWSASVCGGWLENWVLYRRLPEAVSRSRRVARLLGEARAQRLGAFLARSACGLGSNVSLGVLLGMTPVVGRFFGLPLDVRHVTLSAGTLAFAAASLGPARLLDADVLWALAGLGVIAVGNLGVSFSLGLSAALRARGLQPVSLLQLAHAVLGGREVFPAPAPAPALHAVPVARPAVGAEAAGAALH